MNDNILNIQVFHKIKCDFKNPFYVIERFRDFCFTLRPSDLITTLTLLRIVGLNRKMLQPPKSLKVS